MARHRVGDAERETEKMAIESMNAVRHGLEIADRRLVRIVHAGEAELPMQMKCWDCASEVRIRFHREGDERADEIEKARQARQEKQFSESASAGADSGLAGQRWLAESARQRGG